MKVLSMLSLVSQIYEVFYDANVQEMKIEFLLCEPIVLANLFFLENNYESVNDLQTPDTNRKDCNTERHMGNKQAY